MLVLESHLREALQCPIDLHAPPLPRVPDPQRPLGILKQLHRECHKRLATRHCLSTVYDLPAPFFFGRSMSRISFANCCNIVGAGFDSRGSTGP